MKRHAPATERNRAPIAAVLEEHLPAVGVVLEVASGTGEHAVFFAQHFSHIIWQPSDPDPDALASIAAWRSDAGASNLREPLHLDAARSEWPIIRADAIVCCNMAHISPPRATEGLVTGAGRLLDAGAPLLLYGPWLETGVETAPSNLAFDQSLKARDPQWGLRDVAWLDSLAAAADLARTARIAMPANNIMLVYRKAQVPEMQ